MVEGRIRISTPLQIERTGDFGSVHARTGTDAHLTLDPEVVLGKGTNGGGHVLRDIYRTGQNGCKRIETGVSGKVRLRTQAVKCSPTVSFGCGSSSSTFGSRWPRTRVSGGVQLGWLGGTQGSKSSASERACSLTSESESLPSGPGRGLPGLGPFGAGAGPDAPFPERVPRGISFRSIWGRSGAFGSWGVRNCTKVAIDKPGLYANVSMCTEPNECVKNKEKNMGKLRWGPEGPVRDRTRSEFLREGGEKKIWGNCGNC
ncbi:hypothetical protein EDB80DRAFT_739402 [Ilyonectria destructans]|nr:hypothetical protein EDB80DRAFT_739402 [Ilyonectria destructans]